MPPELTTAQRQYLKRLAHGMDPVVQIGSGGLSDGVIKAVDDALRDHELVKVRLGKGIEDDKKAMAAELAQRLEANLCQVIGRVVVLFRQAREPKRRKIRLSAARAPKA